jgi:hypothetical protein
MKMRSIAGVLVIAALCVQVFFSSAAISKFLQQTVLSIQEPQVRVVRHPDNNALNDKTISWSRDVHRLWLGNHVKETDLPPAQTVVTNFGWNHPNRILGLNYSRTLRSTGLMEGVINHPWFHPTAWDDFEKSNISQIDKSIRYYVFLDGETCFESNWPNYGPKDSESNYDLMYNRASSNKGVEDNCYGLRHCGPIYRALESEIFHTTGSMRHWYCLSAVEMGRMKSFVAQQENSLSQWLQFLLNGDRCVGWIKAYLLQQSILSY